MMQGRHYDTRCPTFEHSSPTLPTSSAKTLSTPLKPDYLSTINKVEQIMKVFKAYRSGGFPQNGPLSEQVSEREFELILSKLDDDIDLKNYVFDKVW